MEATISANNPEQNFHFPLRTITNDAIAETKMVRTVDIMVIIREFLNTFQKFIFAIASGKFCIVNPWAPTSARGSETISAFVLKTLMITRMNGMIKRINSRISIMIMIA